MHKYHIFSLLIIISITFILTFVVAFYQSTSIHLGRNISNSAAIGMLISSTIIITLLRGKKKTIPTNILAFFKPNIQKVLLTVIPALALGWFFRFYAFTDALNFGGQYLFLLIIFVVFLAFCYPISCLLYFFWSKFAKKKFTSTSDMN